MATAKAANAQDTPTVGAAKAANAQGTPIVGAAKAANAARISHAGPWHPRTTPRRWSHHDAPMPIARSHRLRTGRTTEPGRIYLLTFTTRGRVRHFADWTVASTAARALAAPANWSDSRLLCWVLMPDHWHGLVRLGVRDTLSRNVGRAKAGATRALHQEPGGPDLPWMQGFHDRALREEDDILDAARYIVANPLRAGLARRLGDYPFWDAVWL